MSNQAPISSQIFNNGSLGSSQLARQTTIEPVSFSKEHFKYEIVDGVDAPEITKELVSDERGNMRQRNSDGSYVLSLVERTGEDGIRTEDIVGLINDFRTGVKLYPPPGYCCAITGNSQLTYAGYQLPNSPLIIQPHDNDEVIVPLLKFTDSEDIELSFPGLQIILLPINYAHPSKISSVSSYYQPQAVPQPIRQRTPQRKPPQRGRRSNMA